MKHTLSDIEEIINSTNSAELIPVKCENCGSKIKASNVGKHSECSIYRNHHAKSFLRREAFQIEVKLKPPTKLEMFIVGSTAKQGYQSIAPPLSKHHGESLRIPEPQPDLPIAQQSDVQYKAMTSQIQQTQQLSQFSLNLHDKTFEKENFDNLSLYSKKEEPLPTTARNERTGRSNEEQPTLSVLGTARSRHFLQEEITYRPTLDQQMMKQNSGLKTTRSTFGQGLFSLFSCMTEHGAMIKQNQVRSDTRPGLCPCCLREAHQPSEPHQQKLNNFQIQRKKIMYDRWLQARTRYKSIPSISFQQAFKRHRYLKEQQFCGKIRQYFY